MTPIRLLLVDDSPSVRAVLRRMFSAQSDMRLVGEAPDGKSAVDAVHEFLPDVILMDLHMPVMDGYTAIERIMRERPTPIIVLTSRAKRSQMGIGFEALRRGALEVLPKPEDTGSWRKLALILPEMVRSVAAVRKERSEPRPVPPAERRYAVLPPNSIAPAPLRWVAIGASTGGPVALRDLLHEIPGNAPVTFLVVQHISPGFEIGLADWLDKEIPLQVRLAEDGETPSSGTVRLAPAGAHLRLGPGGCLQLDRTTPPRRSHRPSADELMTSCAVNAPRASAGVIMTGMGGDGAEGLLALRRAGGLTLVQDEASCAVFGMPRVALEKGAADLALAPADLGRALCQAWGTP